MLNEKLCKSQSAFINKRWITDNVREVSGVLHNKKDGWLLFVDFSKAYDSVNRNSLLQILKAYKFNTGFVNFVRTSLRPYQIFSQRLGIDFRVEKGVPQGWSLSCVLFNLVIDPLLRELERELPSLFQSAFADDLCFHHRDNTILPSVQKFINQYGDAVGLAVNEKKCAVITLDNKEPTTRSAIGYENII
jgi:hypothetical protein